MRGQLATTFAAMRRFSIARTALRLRRGLVDLILEAWKNSAPPDFPNYAADSEEPRAAHELTAAEGQSWRSLIG